MATLDIFNGDAFTLSSLSQTITDLPRIPTRLGDSGLFTESGINTLTTMIERQGSSLKLVPAAPRGGVPQPISMGPRKLIPVAAIHLPQTGTIDADEVQGIRAFGNETELDTVLKLVARKAKVMKDSNDLTLEYHRAGAVKGQILDADGVTVLSDIYSLFGMTQTVVPFNINTSGTTSDIKAKTQQVMDSIDDAMGGRSVTGYRALVARDFFAKLTGHDSLKQAWALWQQGQYLREQQDRRGFYFAGVTYEVYGGGVGGIDFIPSGTGYAFPEGVPGMFTTTFVPANFIETVNTIGLPYYLRQKPNGWGTGIDLYAQSNPITLNTLPEAVIKLTTAAT